MDKDMIHTMAGIMADHLFLSLGGDERKTWLLQSDEFSIAIVCDQKQKSVEPLILAGKRIVQSHTIDYSGEGEVVL